MTHPMAPMHDGTEPRPTARLRRSRNRTRRGLCVVAASVLVIAACASTTTLSNGGSATRRGTNNALLHVTVPDAFTSLTLVPVSRSTIPFLGSDNKYHVAYDLQLTNTSNVPATLDRIDVVDASHPTKVIASFSGSQLVDPSCAFGDCNRLRLLPSADAPNTAIAPQESRAVLIDFTLDSLGDVPNAVMHHLYAAGKASPPAQTATPIDYLAAPFDLSGGPPRVISAPVRGNNWIALNGCCEPGFPHRTSLLPLNGKLNNSQRFAIDWKRVNDQGEFYTGDRNKNTSYVDYGANIYAVADGTVVSTLDNIDPGHPGILPAADPALARKLTLENVDGNHIILDLGGGVFAMYGHLLKGSLLVKPGDKVKAGQVIAKLGNTGNSNASHLHFQLMNGPSLFEADGLPYVIDRFVYEGQVAPERIIGADDFLTGKFLQDKLPIGQPRTNELPLLNAIVAFPTASPGSDPRL
jgi:Peptidase family M23